MPSVQEYIKEKLVTELRTKINTDLNIGSIHIKPFNTIQLNDIYLNGHEGDTILVAEKIYAGFELLPLLNNNLTITDARLSDFKIYLSKDNPNTPLNIQFIIDAFKPKESGSKNKLDVKINSINIANGNLHFDVKDQPLLTNKFDPSHIEVSGLNAKLALKSLNTDSLNIQIKKLELKEKSGLVIDNLIARFITKDQHLSIKGFKLSLPKSLLQFDKFEVDYSIFRIPADLISYATFETQINSSYVVLKDISAFVPALEHFEDRILFKTDIRGKVDSIRIKEIRLDYGDKMHLSAEGFIQDIRNNDKTFVQGNINSLTVSEDGIIGILNNLSKEKKELPPVLSNLGPVSFNGDISGYLKHMNARGNLQSQLGNIDANAIIGIKPDKNTEYFFDGKVETKEFLLGELLNNKDLDIISFDFIANATKLKNEKIKGSVDGIIHDITFKNYAYHDIDINAKYDENIIDGGISFDDPNAIFSINGLFDLSEAVPKMNFNARLKNVRLDNLNLSEKYKEAYFSLYMDANFSGKSIDDLQGSIKADSITFLQSGKRFEMNNFLIEASGGNEERILSINSDIINGKVTGVYSFSTILESFKKTFNYYLPSLVSYKEKKNINIKDNNLHFDFTINNTENASDVFKLPVTIYSPTKFVGFYDNQLEKFKLEAFMPSLNAAGSKIQSGYLIVQNTDDKLSSNISGSFVTKKGTVNDLSIEIAAKNDVVDIHTLFLNKDKERLKGEFSNSISFSRTNNNSLQTDFHFLPGELVLNNTLWEIKKSWIRIAEGNISVNDFTIKSENKEQELNIDGTYSAKNENERLDIKLKNIDLDYIFTTLAIDALQFGGSTNGSLNVSSIQGKPYADVNLDVADFSFNKTNLGRLVLTSDLDTESLKVNMHGQIINENNKKTDIDGYIKPVTQELSIDFDAEEVNMAFLNKYVETLFNNVQGRGKGKVRLFGDFSNVTVEGTAFVQNGGIGINFLNTYYTFTDTVYMKKDLIYFSDISFNDEKGNIAKVSGRVVHDYFTNFMYYVELAGSNFMLYNTTERMNPMFYGTVFASGTGIIKGDEQAVDLNMNIRTNSNTNVYMNFMEETAEEYSFITYKTPEQKKDSINGSNGNGSIRNRLNTNSGIEMNMNFYVDATPDATVELLMDPVGGDRIKGTGSGAMQFVWGTNKDPMLYGTYNILQGSYNFTFQKLMERRFIIQDGSSVQFRGDPFQANLDVTATYRVVANLNDLDRNLAEISGQSSIPVNCLLYITGPLRRPNVGLDIELPNADPEIQRQVKSLMPTEDMINRQIVYLLILSKFYTPNYAVTDQKTSDFAALASATLSTQLSKMLSKIDDRWQIGTNIRTSDSELNNTEVELILSSRLLNDRVLFNGNFGYRDNIYTNDAFIGDIDIEVLLNRIGTWRLKAYNHYNEKYYYIKNSTQTQGLGIVYKRDFDNLRELFKRPEKVQKPLEKDTIAAQDSIPLSAEFVIMKK